MASSFVFDANRCTGCGACRVACSIENGLAPDVSWGRIETFNASRHPRAPVFHLSIACNHCATAACMQACPARAYRRDAPTGAVLVDPQSCIGCGYCAWACPYDAPVFDEAAGVMTKCTWCVDRIAAGLKPSCAVHCPTGALDFGGVAERTQVMTGLPATGLDPSLHVIPLEPGRTVPEMTVENIDEALPIPVPVTAVAQRTVRISLHSEWPLAVFTLSAAILVGAFGGMTAGAYRLDARWFAAAGAAVMMVPAVHLGQKRRAWRAMLNVRTSWLSREIVVLSAFCVIAVASLIGGPAAGVLSPFAAITGLAGLYCADKVYGVLPGGAGYRHSASVTLSGLLFSAAFGGAVTLGASALAAKLVLHVCRTWPLAARGGGVRPALALLRVASGFAGPPLVWLWLGPSHPLALACLVAGETLDRCEYYMGLERRTPRREMDLALRRLVA